VRAAFIEVHHGRDGKAARETADGTETKMSPRRLEPFTRTIDWAFAKATTFERMIQYEKTEYDQTR
jgi:hypothetical protein